MADLRSHQREDLDDLHEIIFGPGNNNTLPVDIAPLPATQDLDISPILDTGIQASVEILDLKELYDKYQKKNILFGSEQRIENGQVHFSASASAQIADIRIHVQRCPEAAQKCNDNTGPVQLVVNIDSHDLSKTYFSANLDSVYRTDAGSFVYDLKKVEVEERNRFNLIISLEFIDKTVRHFESQPFRIRTKPRSAKKNTESDAEGSIISSVSGPSSKRPRGDSDERQPLLSPDGSVNYGLPSPSSGGDSPNYESSSGRGSYNTNEVLTDYLEAQRAKIGILKVTNMICTPNADIAYHLRLKRTYIKKTYVEGDIVGFFEGEDGETEIDKLTNDNASNARMAGVISRSAYLYGNLSEGQEETTDSVCVIGIVKAKVMGPVQNGEKVFASYGLPGVAIPESSLALVPFSDKPPTLLGQALNKSQPGKLNDITLVKCFVSIVLGIQSQQVASAVSDIRNSLDKRIHDHLQESKRKSRRVWIRNGIIIFIVLVLVGALLYEIFCPGSAFRYWLCRKGSIPGHTLRFVYTTNDYQTPTVNGIEFEWSKLKDKMDFNFDEMPGDDVHYYLNIDRCAYGGVRTVGSWLDHYKQVRGAEVFAVNSTCTGVFFEMDDKWKVYTSARDIYCTPPYKQAV